MIFHPKPTGAEALHGAGARFTILEGWEGDWWRLTVPFPSGQLAENDGKSPFIDLSR